MEELDALIAQLRNCPEAERAPIIEKLMEHARGERGDVAREHLARAARSEVLEIQWELEDLVEAASPAPPTPPAAEPEPEPEPEAEAEPEPEAEPEDPAQPILVYDDPRGLRLYKTHDGERWVALQVDPTTGQPRQMELLPEQVTALKTQLLGSPYWVNS